MSRSSPRPSFFVGRAAIALVALVAIFGPGCTCTCGTTSGARFQPGYATFWVEFTDVVIDRFGNPQPAYCSNPVTFSGDIDTICPSFPMVWSYARYDWMSCVYVDSVGQPLRYTDLYYFGPGYIQEPPCQSGYPHTTEVDTTDVNAMTTQERDSEGRVVAAMDVTLASEPASLSELRALLERPERAPDDLPTDEPAVVRTSETTLGEGPDGGTDGG